MSVNEEKEKAAALCRLLAEKNFEFTAGNVAHVLGYSGTLLNTSLWNALALLAEPTKSERCSNVAIRDAIFECSECGASFVNEPIDGGWSYCPSCGREIEQQEK